MNFSDFKNHIELIRYFENDKDKAIKYFEKFRWNGKPYCPKCACTERVKKFKGQHTYKCYDCNSKFSATVGTIFENTKIPLYKWFAAIYVSTSHKKGISSIQLGKDIGVTQKTAWFLLHRVREMLTNNEPILLTGIVEVDETFVGGKEKNKHQSKKAVLKRIKEGKANQHGRSIVDKTPVVGAVSRDGRIITRAIPNTKSETLHKFIRDNVAIGTTMFTDEYSSYKSLGKDFPHDAIQHRLYEYVRGEVHTKIIEGYWSLFKRGIYGIYHQVSRKHLQRYCDEFGFRYTTRNLTEVERYELALTQAAGRRLNYKNLIAVAPQQTK